MIPQPLPLTIASTANPPLPSSHQLNRRAQGPLSLERVFRPAIAKVNLALVAARARDPWIAARPSPHNVRPSPPRGSFVAAYSTILPASRHATVNGCPHTIPSTTTAPPRRSSSPRPRLSRARSPPDAPSLRLRAVAAVALPRCLPRCHPPQSHTRISESARRPPGLISSEQSIAQVFYDSDTAHASTPLVGHPSRALQLIAQRLTRRRRHHGSCGPAGQ